VEIYSFLQQNDIHYQRIDHPAVFTCEQAAALVPAFDGAETKNLFLKDKKGRHHFLVVTDYGKTVALRDLGPRLGVTGLSFASADRLAEYLGVAPGSVTLLALVNDRDRRVTVVIDRDLWQEAAFGCHPLVNTSTLVLARTELEKFIRATGHPIQLIDIPGVAASA